jgi:hypothetical protein
VAKENREAFKKKASVLTEFSSVVSGLRCFLQETATDIVQRISEDYFNINA